MVRAHREQGWNAVVINYELIILTAALLLEGSQAIAKFNKTKKYQILADNIANAVWMRESNQHTANVVKVMVSWK